MFEYMQITKMTNKNGYRHNHICHRGKHELYCDRVLMQSPIKPTRGDAMSDSTKNRKPGITVDAWAILFLVVLVAGAALFWAGHP